VPTNPIGEDGVRVRNPIGAHPEMGFLPITIRFWGILVFLSGILGFLDVGYRTKARNLYNEEKT